MLWSSKQFLTLRCYWLSLFLHTLSATKSIILTLFNIYWNRFANKKAYIIVYGISACILSSTYSYFNATITTLEKRYKIPTRNTAFISVGNDISQLIFASVLCYYAGSGHRPRWMAFCNLIV